MYSANAFYNRKVSLCLGCDTWEYTMSKIITQYNTDNGIQTSRNQREKNKRCKHNLR